MSSNNNSTEHEFGNLFELEIIVLEEYYQIIADGKILLEKDILLPIEMVDLMRIEVSIDKFFGFFDSVIENLCEFLYS